MKKILTILGLVAAFALSASAQSDPIYQVLIPAQASNGAPVSHIAVLTAAATNLYAVIDVRKQKNVGVQIATTNTAPDAVGKNSLYYQRSVDGVNYESALSVIAWNANTNIVPQLIMTNIDTFGCGYIRFTYLTNACGSTTNIGDFNLSYGLKIKAP